jgi:hypothetical protein
MAIRIGPFVLLRRRLPVGEFASLARKGLETLLPVSQLLRRQGISLGRVRPGEAVGVELTLVREHLAATRALARRLAGVTTASPLRPVYDALRRALDVYRATLDAYAQACAAVGRADAEAYRAANRRGRELDAATCAAAQVLLDALAAPKTRAALGELAAPPALERAVARAAELRRLTGGAFAFWE